MAKTFHFISGLPRSGSTLLAAILKQNPRFSAGMTGPVGSLFMSLQSAMSQPNEYASFIEENQRERLLRAIFDEFYRDYRQPVIFDTNRMWCARLPALVRLFPTAKVLCTVRNVAWIMDSIERLVRKNSLQNSTLFNGPAENDTVYHRVEALAQRNRFVGFSYYALKEAVYGEEAKNLLLIEYDLLTQAPDKVVPLIYQFLGEPLFKHDFDHLDYQEPQFDERLGLHGLHEVKRQVRFQTRKTVLPPDLFQQYSSLDFWKNLQGSAASFITNNPAPAPTATIN